ncbi:MAG: sensor histidine kinase, partial [Terrimicrobiaceae bacterium]
MPKAGEIISAYAEYHNRLLSRSLMIANGLSITGVPVGIILDLSFYPRMFWQFFAIRACVVVILLAVTGLVFLGRKSFHPRRIKGLAILAALSMNFAVCLMMFMTDGARSPYDAGLSLIITCWAVMLPWTVLETSIMCLLSLIGYVVACVANPTFSDPATLPIFLFNCVFILITTLVCIGISYFLSRVRFEEFRLRYQIDIQNRELQDMDRLKTQFFSNISHELRTPLTLILGPVESLLARGEPLDARVQEGLVLVHRNALRLLKLINDLLDLMRLEEGAEILRKRQLSLGAYLRGIVDSVKHLGLSKKLKIRLENGNEEDELYADPARMEKVLLNLLTNAIKYTPPSGTV